MLHTLTIIWYDYHALFVLYDISLYFYTTQKAKYIYSVHIYCYKQIRYLPVEQNREPAKTKTKSWAAADTRTNQQLRKSKIPGRHAMYLAEKYSTNFPRTGRAVPEPPGMRF